MNDTDTMNQIISNHEQFSATCRDEILKLGFDESIKTLMSIQRIKDDCPSDAMQTVYGFALYGMLCAIIAAFREVQE